jgi:hypothetical protein
MALVICAGCWVGGSGAHKRHTGECSRPAVWHEFEDGLWAYCDQHVPENKWHLYRFGEQEERE